MAPARWLIIDNPFLGLPVGGRMQILFRQDFLVHERSPWTDPKMPPPARLALIGLAGA
jgi:hypothetical protein